MQELKDAAASATSKENSRKSSGNENEAKILGLFSDSHHYIKLYENLKSVFMVQRNTLDRNDKVKKTYNSFLENSIQSQIILRSKVLCHPFYLPRCKLAWSTQQASSMHLRHETTPLSTPLPFWICIITLGK